MLTHQAYLDASQALNSRTAAWRAVVAGMLVLRLVDEWLDGAAALIVRDRTGPQAVREALARMRERDPMLPMLRELVDIVTQSERATVQAVVSPMFQYGRLLHQANQWNLALDVFASVMSHAQAARDHLTTVRAANRVGFVFKRLGQLDASDSAYTLAIENALCINRPDLYLKASWGRSWNLASRGRITEAEHIISMVVTEAGVLGLTDMQAAALHDLSSLALFRGDYTTAVRIGRTALMYMSRPTARDRLLGNLGAAFVGLGDHHAARKIILPLLQRTQEETIRQPSLINLLEIAAKEEDQSIFNRYCRELDGTIVLPDLQAHYHLYVAKGHYIFKNPTAAKEAWQKALEIAEAHELTQMCTVIRSDMTAVRRHS